MVSTELPPRISPRLLDVPRDGDLGKEGRIAEARMQVHSPDGGSLHKEEELGDAVVQASGPTSKQKLIDVYCPLAEDPRTVLAKMQHRLCTLQNCSAEMLQGSARLNDTLLPCYLLHHGQLMQLRKRIRSSTKRRLSSNGQLDSQHMQWPQKMNKN